MAIDWTIPRLDAFRYYRVDYATRQELEELTTVRAGGQITRNVETTLKETGTIPVVGGASFLGDDMVRIYYNVTDDDGNSDSFPLATMHAVRDQSDYSAAAQESQVRLYSGLLTLQDAVIKESFTLDATDVAVDEAVAICTTLGLPVVYTPSTRELQTDASWNPGTKYLTIVNYLLDLAGYWSAGVDGWGRITMTPYQDPAERTPLWQFVSGENCIYLPKVAIEAKADIPNVCVLIASNPTGALVGTYTNSDPSSPYSTVSRGREIALVQTVTDAVDETELDARAQRRLIEATVGVEKVTINHAYAPVYPGDVVQFGWDTHGLSMKASIQAQTISLIPSALTTASLKKVWE